MKKIISTPGAPAAVGPYSQAVEAGGMLFISGQIPIDPATAKVVEGGIKEQTRRVLQNIGAILEEGGYSYSDLVKCTVLLESMDHFGEMNEVYKTFFPENPPARAAFGVVRLPLGVMVEIEAIAAK